MALSNGYGVVIGTIQDYYRDDPDAYGRYYHGNLILTTPSGAYHCPIDVDSKQSNTGVEWRTVPLHVDELVKLTSLGLGYHSLQSNGQSGAIDYIRSPQFKDRLGCLAIILLLTGRRLDVSELWRRGTSAQALDDLEPLITTTRTNSHQAIVLGEPFTSGLGVHNIHQNQGDPAGTIWWNENGTWQDGCTILQQAPDTYVAFLNKFTTQSYWTDNNGHPS